MMTRNEAYSLYMATLKIKSGALPVGTMVKYIELREKLARFIEAFNSAKMEMSLQTKPEGWKEGDDDTEWNKSYQALIKEYMKEAVDINPHILTKDEVIQIYLANQDLPGDQLDYIKKMLTIEDEEPKTAKVKELNDNK